MLPVVFPDSTSLWLFCLAALALLAIPGPAVLYIVVQSAEQGRRAGLASVGGVHLGSLVHVAAATAGLSAVIVASAFERMSCMQMFFVSLRSYAAFTRAFAT